MTNAPRIALVVPLAAALAGCGGTNEYSPAPGMAPAQIFSEVCQACHGEGGSGKLGFLLKVAGSDEPAAAMAAHIADGGPVMPAFPNISEADRLALAEYLKAQK